MRAFRLIILVAATLSLFFGQPASASVPSNFIPSAPWYRNCASLDLDFYNDQYYINHNTTCDGTIGTTYTAGSGNTGVQNFITGAGATFTRAGTNNVTDTNPPFYLDATQGQSFVSRASSGTYFDNTGTLQTASTNTARSSTYSYNGSAWVANSGTLVEPAAINYLRYNTMVGAVIGTPGTAPTTWSVNASNGITSSIVGTGTENGINYVDVQYSGTTTATTYLSVQFANSTGIFPASPGQTWTMSGFVKLTAGSWGSYLSVGKPQWTINEYSSSGFNVQGNGPFSSLPTAANLATQRVTFTYNVISASTIYLNTYFNVGYASGVAVNFTVRIGMPQMEQSSTATSVIATTGNSAVTRAADVYSVPNGGTYFNSSGVMNTAPVNTPRLDHSPVSPYAAEGVLIEESRANIVAYSSNQTATGWSLNGGSLNHTATAPDGSTAYSVVGSANFAGVWYGWPTAASTTYTLTAFVKNISGGSIVEIGPTSACFGSGPSSAALQFNDVAGTFSSIAAGVTSYSAQQLSNGWWRVAITTTSGSSSCSQVAFVLYSMNGSTASENAVWGAQIEAGAFPTSYIPTSGSTVTRAADVFTLPTTAGGGWHTQGVGTLLASATIPFEIGSGTADVAERMVGMDDGTSANSLTLQVNNVNSYKGNANIVVSSSLTYSQLSASGLSNNALIKGALAYNGTNAYSAFNGTSLTSSSSTAVSSSLTRLNIGMTLASGVFYLNGWESRVTYFPIMQPSASLPQFTQ
jgi:hypothetical protein